MSRVIRVDATYDAKHTTAAETLGFPVQKEPPPAQPLLASMAV